MYSILVPQGLIFRSTFIALIYTNTKGEHIRFTLNLSAKDANQNKVVLNLSKHFLLFFHILYLDVPNAERRFVRGVVLAGSWVFWNVSDIVTCLLKYSVVGISQSRFLDNHAFRWCFFSPNLGNTSPYAWVSKVARQHGIINPVFYCFADRLWSICLAGPTSVW